MKKQKVILLGKEKNVHVEIGLGKFQICYGALAQCWELGEPPYSYQVEGGELNILQESQDWILAFQKVIVATSEFTRMLLPLILDKHLKEVWVEISSKEITLKVFLIRGNQKELIFSYAAVDGLLVVQSEQQHVFECLPVNFESFFKEICLGRYGLLQRLLHRAVQRNTTTLLERGYEGRRETA